MEITGNVAARRPEARSFADGEFGGQGVKSR